jgi:hypothetical protein
VAWEFRPQQDDEDLVTASAIVRFHSKTQAPVALTATVPVFVLSNKTISRSSLKGTVYDSAGTVVSDAIVTAVVLAPYWRLSNGSDSATTTAQQGIYVIHGAPDGVPIRLTAAHPNFDAQVQTIKKNGAIPSSLQPDDFGKAGATNHPTALRRPSL